MIQISKPAYKYINEYLKNLGYSKDCLDHIDLSEENKKIVVLDYPCIDHYNGVPDSLLKILIKDIDKAIESYNSLKK